ncbi:MAG TPA: hypothetical protein VI750_05925 [Pyrinomonadaceae bacterium]|nr:hypothetical protein [Pyrinomonadaceae bacterium]HLE62652.1 hypothetical protein [Pyrinomonadaceae bacterium]
MGLSDDDPQPTSISLRDAYAKIRVWYRANKSRCRVQDGDYVQRSFALIDKLPGSEALSELELRAVLGEVIYGNLEWGYHESDGKFKIAAYAHAALKQAGHQFSLDEHEKQALDNSQLWPYLSINRNI